INNWAYMWMAVFMILGYALLRVVQYLFGVTVLKWFSVSIIVLLMISLAYSAWQGTTNEKRIVHTILFVAIVVRLYYIMVTAQAAYGGEVYEIIQTMNTEMTLPDVAQPLYYVVASVLSSLAGMISFTASSPMEIVRLVNEYFGVVCVIIMHYILCELEVNDTATYIGVSIIAFHPGLIMAGGELSPTMLLTMLLMFTMLYLSRWNNFTDGYNFVLMSVCLGLAVMTDLRAFVFLPVVFVLVIINIVRVFKRKQAINMIANIIQAALGLAIWTALSFAYPVRNAMSGKSTGLLSLANDISANSANLNLDRKFLSFSVDELLSVFTNPQDKNAWAYLVKSSMFGGSEKSLLDINIMRIFIMLSLAIFIIMALMGIALIFARIDAKKKVNIWTILALSLCVVGYYILLNIGRPVEASMAFGNIAVILAIGTAMLCAGINVLNKKKKLNFVSGILYMLVVAAGYLFCVCSVAYNMIFFVQ
ncbi:MAG: phospholipid carrier-dependent glycosyltransferase, partial [Firmicutes bacterium]|nr:phospholipid carrier-dependent glycosyltransferase [Bacillota bacterium]